MTGRRVTLQVASPAEIASRIEETYQPERAINRLLDGLDTPSIETIDEEATGAPRDPALQEHIAGSYARSERAIARLAAREGIALELPEVLPDW